MPRGRRAVRGRARRLERDRGAGGVRHPGHAPRRRAGVLGALGGARGALPERPVSPVARLGHGGAADGARRARLGRVVLARLRVAFGLPSAVVVGATGPAQWSWTGPLADLQEHANVPEERAELPGLLVLGPVVALADAIAAGATGKGDLARPERRRDEPRRETLGRGTIGFASPEENRPLRRDARQVRARRESTATPGAPSASSRAPTASGKTPTCRCSARRSAGDPHVRAARGGRGRGQSLLARLRARDHASKPPVSLRAPARRVQGDGAPRGRGPDDARGLRQRRAQHHDEPHRGRLARRDIRSLSLRRRPHALLAPAPAQRVAAPQVQDRVHGRGRRPLVRAHQQSRLARARRDAGRPSGARLPRHGGRGHGALGARAAGSSAPSRPPARCSPSRSPSFGCSTPTATASTVTRTACGT